MSTTRMSISNTAANTTTTTTITTTTTTTNTKNYYYYHHLGVENTNICASGRNSLRAGAY